MSRNTFAELENSNVAPFSQIQLREFIEGVLKAGSLISIFENKKINTTTLFSLLLEKSDYQEFFTEITSSNTFRESLSMLLYLNPSLVKSKFTKSLTRKTNGKTTKSSNRSRKAFVQQTLDCIEE